MTELEDLLSLVVDIGSWETKVGFSGDKAPYEIFRSVVGYERNPGVIVRDPDGFMVSFLVVDEAMARCGLLRLKYPVEGGRVSTANIDHYNKLVDYSMRKRLRKDWRMLPEKCRVLLSDKPFDTPSNRAEKCENLFEKCEIPYLNIVPESALAIYASGRTTGTVLDIGYQVTSSSTVFESDLLPRTVTQMEIGGEHITTQFTKIMIRRGYEMTCGGRTTRPWVAIPRAMKEKMCYVSLDFEKDLKMCKENDNLCRADFVLPDGSKMGIGSHRFRGPEMLFRPQLILDEEKRKGARRIDQMIVQSIEKSPVSIRRKLYENIVLCGASSKFPGIETRLQNEISKNVPSKSNCGTKVVAPKERENLVWIGGSIVSSLSSFVWSWIPKKLYDKIGPSVVNDGRFSLSRIGKNGGMTEQAQKDERDRVEFMKTVKSHFVELKIGGLRLSFATFLLIEKK